MARQGATFGAPPVSGAAGTGQFGFGQSGCLTMMDDGRCAQDLGTSQALAGRRSG
jgi:hypothetical protein